MSINKPANSAACKKNNELEQIILNLKEENLILKTDVGYWKRQHERTRKREEELKKELQDKNARIKYLEHRLYNRKNERTKAKNEADRKRSKRKKGHQKGTPAHGRRKYNGLEEKPELYDLKEGEKFCEFCGRPYYEIASTDNSDILEVEVKGYKRKIKRKKYAKKCDCEGGKKIIMAPGPDKIIPGSKIGISIWVCILLRKYRFQIPVARILKNLSLNGLDLPAGTIGDGLKRIFPLFEPVYSALEAKSREADWWQADETRWSVFEMTKTKTSYKWYLWVFISEESVIHIIDPSRSAQVIEEHLGIIEKGILLVDRYSAYKSYANKHKGIILAFCWSHARRDVIDAGKKYLQLKSWASVWEDKINMLFHLNNIRIQYPVGSKQFKKEDTQLRKAVTKMRADIDQELKKPRLHYEQEKVLKSLKNHWEGLTVFIEHPHIPMDNNGSERVLRNSAVGRKNYYGSQTVWSGRFTAVMISIFETLEVWGINQLNWLTDYLSACARAGGKPPVDITKFLPWNIKKGHEPTRTYCGRGFSKADIKCIKMIIDEDTSRNRTEIARIACEYLQWYKPDGAAKVRSMAIALLRMERDGHITLPPSQRKKLHTERQIIKHTHRSEPKEDTYLPVDALPELKVTICKTDKEKSLWNEYIDRYHYLGYSLIPGANIKYLIYVETDVVALLGFGACAWRIAPRDTFIGWSEDARKKNLNLVVNNSRFLILPWIFSKNLASKVLSLTAKRISDDWEELYKYRPVLLETFVEDKRFSGTCYKAANWQYIGMTKGRGKKDKFNRPTLPLKKIFVYPIKKDFRKILC